MSPSSSPDKVAQFIELCLAWEKSQQFSKRSSINKSNHIFDQIKHLESELASDEDGRCTLVDLLVHPSAVVRFKAAVACLNFEPDCAQVALRQLEESGDPLYAFYAEMILREHESRHEEPPSPGL